MYRLKYRFGYGNPKEAEFDSLKDAADHLRNQVVQNYSYWFDIRNPDNSEFLYYSTNIATGWPLVGYGYSSVDLLTEWVTVLMPELLPDYLSLLATE